MNVIIRKIIADHGTVVTFLAETEDGLGVHVGVDRRPAQDILDALADGFDGVTVEIESWQVL